MATVLDLSVLNTFTPIFGWILSFLLVYGFLEATNVFKNKGIHAMLAFVFSILVAISGTASLAIASMAPWFLVIIFFVFMIYLIGNFMGVGSNDILGALGGRQGAIWWILIVGFIILAGGLSQVFGEQLLKARQAEGNVTYGPDGVVSQAGHGQAVLLILTNARVLGMLLIFFIAALTVALLTGPIKP